MAITENTYTGNGTSVLFPFTFPYLDSADVKVTLNGTLTTAYTFANATTIQFTSAPAAGVSIRIYRETANDEASATFFPGSSIKASDLNNNFTQILYAVQEVVSRYISKFGGTMLGILNMGGFKIINVGTPTLDADSATKKYVDDRYGQLTVPGVTRWRQTATAGQTVFSGAGEYGGTLAYSASRETVFINGVLQQRNVDYTADNGTTVTFAVALEVGDVVDVHCVNNANGATTDQASGIYWTQTGSGAITRTVDSKLKDAISVKDFGAVGDGTTNDTAAINAALATGKTVYFPQGTYATTGGHTIATNGQCIIGDGPWESIIKKLSGTSELLRVARLTNGCGVVQIGFDCNALAGTALRWKSHYSFIKDIRISNGVNGQWGLHLTGVNVSYFDGLTIEETGGCILIDQNNDTDPATTYSLLYSRFRNLWLVPKNTQALKIEGQAQDIVFDGIYVETASTVVPNPPAITLSSAGPITDIHFYNIGCEHNVLQSTFIDITGTSTAQNDIYNICFRGGRLTSGYAGQDKPLIRVNKVNNLIVDGLLFYCDQNLLNRPHIELTDCTNVKVVNNSVYSYPNDFIFIKDNGGCTWVTDDNNTRIRINASGGSGTNQWGLTGASSNISSINSGMSQSFTNATKVTSTDYQLAPSIRAYRNSASSLAHNVATKWAFSTVDAGYDPSACYSTGVYRFTPTVKGFYSVSMKGVIATGGSNLVFTTQIYKNGSAFSSMQDGGTGGTNGELAVSHTDLVYMNGTTDYLEGYFYQYDFGASASKTVQAGAFIAAHFVRSV